MQVLRCWRGAARRELKVEAQQVPLAEVAGPWQRDSRVRLVVTHGYATLESL